eukprot:TRINITY_DN2748_c0_g2_i2.p1 TRINITY_DN2748_c0_g2~~TRINITY_DN2748_c0_g2_i2.p1  ORF type:complete len:599 (+),score=152.87 TRINITY_DN2748_c0_g2_i2:177-1973(+)
MAPSLSEKLKKDASWGRKSAQRKSRELFTASGTALSKLKHSVSSENVRALAGEDFLSYPSPISSSPALYTSLASVPPSSSSSNRSRKKKEGGSGIQGVNRGNANPSSSVVKALNESLVDPQDNQVAGGGGNKKTHRRSKSINSTTSASSSMPVCATPSLPNIDAQQFPRTSNVPDVVSRIHNGLNKILLGQDTKENLLISVPCTTFNLEIGCDPELFKVLMVRNNLIVDDLEGDEPQFKLYFWEKDHTNYIGSDENGTFIISVEGPGVPGMQSTTFSSPRDLLHSSSSNLDWDSRPLRILVRSFDGTKRNTINGSKKKKKKLRELYPVLPSKLSKIKDPKLDKDLLQLENQHCDDRINYKFGVLYCNGAQTEDEMYGNEHGSENFNEFLECIGERVQLLGWNKFCGGLDNKRNSTGTHSVWTRYNAFQIMYHVSTLLPFSSTDVQQLERKRHLGNDVAVIIFKDGNVPWNPRIMRSHFNYIFCVVSKVPSTETVTQVCVIDPETREISVQDVKPGKDTTNTTFYRVAFASKKEVRPFTPNLPEPAIFEKSNELRDFLIVKLINGERATMYAPEFATKLRRTRVELLKSIASKYISGVV